MSVLTQGNNLADWLVEEFGAPNYCRAEKVVLVDADMPSGMPLGVHTLTPALYPYNDSAPAAVTGININALLVKDLMPITSATEAAETTTIVFPGHHGLIVGDIIKITGATVDLDLNGFYAVATAADAHTITIATANVADAAYTEATLRVTKVNQPAAVFVRGPAVISAGGLTWAAACGSAQIAAGIVDIKALSPAITVLEGV
jgi:hypothetical protein